MRVRLMLSLWLITFAPYADEMLWERLRRDSNMIVLMRNSESSGNLDGTNMLVWDTTGECKGESILTSEGKNQAKRVGNTFAQHEIRPMVISSPMCRCIETAELAFGEYSTDPDLRQRPRGDVSGQEVFQAKASALLRKHRGKTPIVFVNHQPNIDLLTMELIKIGELLVGNVTENGEVEVLGTIRIIP